MEWLEPGAGPRCGAGLRLGGAGSGAWAARGVKGAVVGLRHLPGDGGTGADGGRLPCGARDCR
eukprot:scaffold17616_cov99-Isochrysis_galbana.AAC.2